MAALLAAGYHVTCCGRDQARLQARFPACRVVEYDVTSPLPSEALDAVLQGVSVVINTVGIIQERGKNTFDVVHRQGPIELFRAASRVGVRRIIHISALGADSQADTDYHLTKRDADDVLRTLPVEWVILQPSLVYGRGGRSYTFFSALTALPVLLMPGHGDQRIQPVHVEDLVAGIVRLVESSAVSRVTLAVVGPEPITFRQFMEAVRGWLGLERGIVVPVPMGLVRLAAWVGDAVRSDFVNSETFAMLCRGNVAEAGPFTTATGVKPRPIATGLPVAAGRSAYTTACLDLLRPLLLAGLSAVWIGSGLVSLFVFPRETSEAWLLRVGIPEGWTGAALVGASLVDIVLGIGTILRRHLSLLLVMQLALIVGYSAVLTIRMPELWAHPFGPLLKNIPLFVVTLFLWLLERRP